MDFFPHRHLLGIKGLQPHDIAYLLDKADEAVKISRQREKKTSTLRGLTQINLFFEASTRTQSSFELAGKRLGADVMNMSVANSSVKKGETLIDTAMTLNAMHPDVLVIRHSSAGAAALLSQKVSCSVINAGDGQHEHPTQALLDALTIRRAKGRLSGITVAICGDVLHSRVARSNIILLNAMGARVRVVAPPTLLPSGIADMSVEVFHDMKEGLKDADVVMMLRLQRERMSGSFVPSVREYYRFYGLDAEKLKAAKNPMIIVGQGALKGANGAAVLATAARIAADCGAVTDEWYGFAVLHTAASRVGALDLGFVPGEGGADASTQLSSMDVLFLLGADELDFSAKKAGFTVYIGSHGDAGASAADVILPGAAYTEKSGTWVNTEGRVQMSTRAGFAPGDAREDWAVLRALSAALGKTLPFDSLAGLRQSLYAAHPHFAALDTLQTTDASGLVSLAGLGGKLDKAGFASPVADFYQTNPIARASAVMAECSALASGRLRQAAE